MNIQEVIDNFEVMDDWEDKYTYLISLGKLLPDMDIALKTDSTKVSGCVSRAWIKKIINPDDTVSLLVDSDAQIVRGLAAIIYIAIDGKTLDELSEIDIKCIFEKIGLNQHLSPNRRNGFFAMLEKVDHLFKAANN